MTISKEIIAFWGAGLSTSLALMKIWELWSARKRVEIVCYFDGRQEVGNDIIVRNLSDKPIIITYWELLFCERKGFQWVTYRNENPAEDTSDICIQGHTSKKINFSGQDYFSWVHKELCGKSLYFNLYIAGKKKSVKRLLYPR